MNAILASIFSPLKESANSRNGQALDRLEGISTPTKNRVAPRRVTRKSVAFDMTPRAQVKHTPPKLGDTLAARELPNSPRRNMWDKILESESVVGGSLEPVSGSTSKSIDSSMPTDETSKPAEPSDEGIDTAVADTPSADKEFAFKRFLDHRWDGDSIQIQVEWDNGQRTWEPETMLHDDTPQALLDYWRGQPDGRPDNPRQPGLYEIHAIRKHSRDRKRLFVEWVGFGPEENTWEPRGTVANAAPEILSDYWDSLPRPKRRRAK
ncbi:Chromo domain protein [Beauveria brongniartii RCEF 3172]|uniref:Chromo domain protein n=1 Tax=Beauveria brongniartii RCEF 3172 TaxID=1081107 RepID=A0A167GG45_9HYPO|nr:Chromo domain protein [Beauveria brongniartii RCEF 3172]